MNYLLSLGSNLGQRSENLAAIRRNLEECCGKITRYSAIYETAPWGFNTEMWFYNQVVEFQCEMEPEVLMQEILLMEKLHGRSRASDGGYQSRSVDVDILLVDELVVFSEQLIIPHPKMHLRKFVLVPAVEIAAERIHPLIRKTLKVLLEDCPDQEEFRMI